MHPSSQGVLKLFYIDWQKQCLAHDSGSHGSKLFDETVQRTLFL